MPAFMLDTNAFNRALDRDIDPSVLSERGHLCITHIQLNELQETKNSERLTNLLSVFEAVEQESIPTAAAVWGVSEFGAAEWGDADGLYDQMLRSLNKRNKSKDNNVHDVLIGVTAVKRGLTLVTDDRDLASVVREHGGHAISFDELLAWRSERYGRFAALTACFEPKSRDHLYSSIIPTKQRENEMSGPRSQMIGANRYGMPVYALRALTITLDATSMPPLTIPLPASFSALVNHLPVFPLVTSGVLPLD